MKREYAMRSVYCKTQEDVDKELNYIYSQNEEPNRIESLNVLPIFDTSKTEGLLIPYRYYINYVYSWMKEDYK